MRRSVRAAAAAIALAAAVAGSGAHADQARVDVVVGHAARGAPVPRDFLGLSFEVAALPQLGRYSSTGNLVALLRSVGRGVLRLGGVTADSRSWWAGGGQPAPAWGRVPIYRSDLAGIARLARAARWHVILTVNLAHYDVEAAAHEAAAARALLGPLLDGIEIGNEPNAYIKHGWRLAPWGPQPYLRQVQSYRAAIKSVAGARVPLLGPDISGSGAVLRWSRPFARRLRPAALTGHHYAMSCYDVPPPAIETLLSPETRAAEGRSLTRYTALARSTRLPFRLDEAGSVSCGGEPGVSNTFAGALWAVDYLTRAMTAGVAGVNLHGQLDNCAGYAPLCAPDRQALDDGRLRAGPEWYALMLLRPLVGERPARAPGCACPDGVYVSSFVGAGGRLRVAIVDSQPDDQAPITVVLHPGRRYRRASATRLTAPSRSATAGLRFVRAPVTPQLTLTVPASSATLVTLVPTR